MKIIRNIIATFLTVCRNCHGMKVLEKPSGDTIECPACKGKGYV